jgi:Cu(I)/Ag(I) efflux system membrane fusion protein
MKRKHFLKTAGILVLVPALLFSACTSVEKHEHEGEEVATQTFTCPMHPQIVQNKPGVCPVCSMDLVPFDKSSEGEALVITETRQALANITVMSIGTDSLNNNKLLNGRLATNPEQTKYISSRVAGRIDQLYVRELGVQVHKGQPIYKIYSEQLAILQQEYLLALAQVQQFANDVKFKQIEEAAKQKLILYNQSPAQIQALAKSKKVDANVTFFAPESGVVAELSIIEGQYVEEGSSVLRLESYANLWVEADLYPQEAANVKIGQEVKVVIPGWENEPQIMKIQFVNPSLQSGSQLIQIRGSIPNPNGQWQAGQQANLFLPMKSEGNVLNLPVDAVIRTGAGTHVWIETEKNTFEARMVTTGIENFDQVEIVEGLTKGDRVVVTGVYLLNSEYILKKGSDPMVGHNH